MTFRSCVRLCRAGSIVETFVKGWGWGGAKSYASNGRYVREVVVIGVDRTGVELRKLAAKNLFPQGFTEEKR